jgi:uncharacterized protein YabN with tetrapyrrole methylase and pyrophosphatase domain
MQEKAAGVGFDWDQTEGVMQKIEEELQEFYEEVDRNDKASAEAEFGDFAVFFGELCSFYRNQPRRCLVADESKVSQSLWRHGEKNLSPSDQDGPTQT